MLIPLLFSAVFEPPTPNRVETYSDFMHEIGAIKARPTWKDLSHARLHSRKGS